MTGCTESHPKTLQSTVFNAKEKVDPTSPIYNRPRFQTVPVISAKLDPSTLEMQADDEGDRVNRGLTAFLDLAQLFKMNGISPLEEMILCRTAENPAVDWIL
jgi:hypothetical protein